MVDFIFHSIFSLTSTSPPSAPKPSCLQRPRSSSSLTPKPTMSDSVPPTTNPLSAQSTSMRLDLESGRVPPSTSTSQYPSSNLPTTTTSLKPPHPPSSFKLLNSNQKPRSLGWLDNQNGDEEEGLPLLNKKGRGTSLDSEEGEEDNGSLLLWRCAKSFFPKPPKTPL